MKKEMLTIDIVKREYKQQFHSSFKNILLSVGLFMTLVAMLLFLFSGLYTIVKLFFVSILLLGFSFCVLATSDYYKASRTLSKCDFIITKDRLIHTEEKHSYVSSAFAASHSQSHQLHFAKYGSYCVPEKNYNFSKLYKMSDQGVVNTSIVNDEFILVIDKKQKIMLAYNTKFFVLENDQIR